MKENRRSIFYRMRRWPKLQRFSRLVQKSMAGETGQRVSTLAVYVPLVCATLINSFPVKTMILSLGLIILLTPLVASCLLLPLSNKEEPSTTTDGHVTPSGSLPQLPPTIEEPQVQPVAAPTVQSSETGYLTEEEVIWIRRNLQKMQVQANSKKDQSYRNEIYGTVIQEFQNDPEHIQLSRFSADVVDRLLSQVLQQSYKQANKYQVRGQVEQREKLLEKVIFLENMKRKFDELLSPDGSGYDGDKTPSPATAHRSEDVANGGAPTSDQEISPQ